MGFERQEEGSQPAEEDEAILCVRGGMSETTDSKLGGVNRTKEKNQVPDLISVL
jgi:hypothetical protein